MPTLPRVDAVPDFLRISHPRACLAGPARGDSQEVGCRARSAGDDRHHERQRAQRHEQGVAPPPRRRHPPRAGDRAVAKPRASIATARSAAARSVRTSSPMVRAPRCATTVRGAPPRHPEPADPAGPAELAPDLAEGVDPLQGGGRRDDRPVGQPQALGEVVAEGVGVDPRDEHGRRQHDDEHPQRHGEGGVEVAAGEEPRRPADREGGDQRRACIRTSHASCPGRRPAPATGRAQARRRRARAGSRAPRGSSTSAATAPPPARRAGPPRAAPAVRSGPRAGCRPAPARARSAAAPEVVHGRRPVDDVGVVGGGDDGATRLPVRGDEPDERGPGVAVLAHRRLVGEQHRWPVVQGRRDREPALLAAGQLARVRRGRGARAPGPRGGRGRARVGGGVVLARAPSSRRQHLLEHRAGDDRRARPLRHPGDRAREVGGRERGRGDGIRRGRRGRGRREHRDRLGSVAGTKPARACSTVDLPDAARARRGR